MNHPLHPALVHFPIGAWGIATGLDVMVLAGIRPAAIWPVSTGLIGVGLGMAILAMGAGAYDLMKIVKHQNALLNRVLVHVSVMAVVWCIYLASLIMRIDGGALSTPSVAAIIVSVVGFAGLVLGGYLGGDLVYRSGANVMQGSKQDK